MEFGKTIGSTAHLVKNVFLHARCIVTRKETPGEAWANLRSDAHKVRVIASSQTEGSKRHRESAKLTESGRKRYNKGDYVKAEQLFRAAILEDPQYALPLTYLGNALQKQGKSTEALSAWERAVKLDPHSDGGRKADRSLRHYRNHEAAVVETLETRVREGSFRGGKG